MEIPLYLSMTAAEFAQCRNFPTHTAWMACHFSPYGSGLTNIPSSLPRNSLLILNDSTPIHKNDPMLVKQELTEIVSYFGCSGVLLDLQRKDNRASKETIRQLLSLPCPVCISDIYADDFDCPVFLPPIPLDKTPEEYLKPWNGREIWLDAAADCCVFTINESGCFRAPWDHTEPFSFREDHLFFHYSTQMQSNTVQFYIQRTKEDIQRLLTYCAAFGVTTAVGLWQELK